MLTPWCIRRWGHLARAPARCACHRYTRLFRRRAASEAIPAPSFLDATPTYFASPDAPYMHTEAHTHVHAMPASECTSSARCSAQAAAASCACCGRYMLAAMMPPPLLARATFIVLLREPVARALSWFNRLRLAVSGSASAASGGGALSSALDVIGRAQHTHRAPLPVH